MDILAEEYTANPKEILLVYREYRYFGSHQPESAVWANKKNRLSLSYINMHRLNIFAKLVELSPVSLLLVVGKRQFRFDHQDKKVVYNLVYSYEKSITGTSVNLKNKQLGDDVIQMLESMGFFIKITSGNAENNLIETILLAEMMSNPIVSVERIDHESEKGLLLAKKERTWMLSMSQEIVSAETSDSTAFDGFLSKRKSQRQFSKNVVSSTAILEIIHSGFGKTRPGEYTDHFSSGSAGGFYELELFLVLFQDVGNIKTGVYLYNKKDITLQFISSIDTEKYVTDCFLSAHFEYSTVHGHFVIGGHLGITTGKYGPRALLYEAIEAGAVSQNMILKSLLLPDIQLLQFGGYKEKNIKEHLAITDNEFVIFTSLLF